MANIQELDNQISIIEADKELLYDILTNKNIAGLSVLDSLETYVKSVSKLSNYAMYDFNTEADMNKSKSYPIGTYGLVIKEVAEESKYNDSTEDTLYTSFDVPTRVQDINYKKIADNQEIVVNINTDLGNTVGQLKITSIDAQLNIKINTYTVKVQWDRIPSEAGEYILSLYEINGVDDYKGGTNYILPEAVDLVLMTEIEDVDLKKSLLKFMPLKNAIYDSLNVYAQTGKWELLFKQLEYEVDTQIKVYNTLEEMNADTVDNYAIGIVLNTEEALRLTNDVVQENRIYKQIILGPEVVVNVPKVAIRLNYTYSDTNYDVTVTLVKESLDEDTRLVVLSSKDYSDAISEVTYTTDVTYTYKVKTKVENTEYDVYTFEIDSKSTYDSKLGITERVNIDSSEFDRVEIDTPKTNTSSVAITSNNCEIVNGLYGKILYINNNQNNEDNHWEFSGIYMYNGNTWQALALGLNASASTIFTGYKAYTDSGAVTGTGTSDANAVAADIMSGKSAYVNGIKIMGTFSLDTELAEQDGLLAEQTQDIADVIIALENRMAIGLQEATSDATATVNDIAKDKTAYVNGVKLVGTLVGGLDIYIQPSAPSVYKGIWIKSNSYTYSAIKEIANKQLIEASTINIIEGSTYSTKFSTNLTYDFAGVYITDSNNDILYDTEIYYGNGLQWVDITPSAPLSGKFAGIRVDFVNGTVQELEGSSPVDELNCYSGRRRCNMQNDGTITAYYGDENYDNVGSENLQVMVEQPKVYYSLQNVEVNNGAIDKADYIVADTKINNDFELHPAFISNGVEYDKVYVGAFEATVVNNKLSSIGGGTITPQVNLTRATARTYALNRGNIWRQLTKQFEDLESLLMTIEYKSFNHQSTISVGVTSGSARTVGQSYTLNSCGTGLQGATVSTIGCFTWRWRENKYGNVYKYNDGLNIIGDSWYIKDYDFEDSTSANYVLLAESATTVRGNISRFAYVSNAKWVFMPKNTGSSSIIGDYCYANSSASWKILISGGENIAGSNGGSFCMSCDNSMSSSSSVTGCGLIAMPISI